MMSEALVARIRYHIQKANFMGLKDAESTLLLGEAADAIEELQQTVEHYKGCSDDWYKEACDYKSMLPRWIPVTERLPEDLTSVIVHIKDGGIFIWEYFNTSPTDECWIDDRMNVYSFYDVTHWQPLPQPPKEE